MDEKITIILFLLEALFAEKLLASAAK